MIPLYSMPNLIGAWSPHIKPVWQRLRYAENEPEFIQISYSIIFFIDFHSFLFN